MTDKEQHINLLKADLAQAREEWNHEAAAMIRTELYVLYGIWEGEE